MEYHVIKAAACDGTKHCSFPIGSVMLRSIDINRAFSEMNKFNSFSTKRGCECKYEIKEAP